jgi:hypothetical protein
VKFYKPVTYTPTSQPLGQIWIAWRNSLRLLAKRHDYDRNLRLLAPNKGAQNRWITGVLIRKNNPRAEGKTTVLVARKKQLELGRLYLSVKG